MFKTTLTTLLLMTASLIADPLLERSSLQNFELILSKEEIQAKVAEAAMTLQTDLQEVGIDKITLVVLMKGAICIGSDLMRNLNMTSEIECIKASSYGMNGMERGELTIENLQRLNLEGKDLLVVDDIFDTGKTLAGVVELLQTKNPKSIRSLVLLDKDVPKLTTYRPNYVLFQIPNLFVLGYGLDYKELWRDLPDIYAVR